MDQDEIEQKHISEMSEFQKEVVTAIKFFGYRYKFNKFYQLEDGDLINIDKIKNLNNLISVFYQAGAQEKLSEIKRILEIQ